MKIEFDNPKHEKLANGTPEGLEKYIRKKKAQGHCSPESIILALNELAKAKNLSDIDRSFNFHPLKYNLKGRFAVDATVHAAKGRGLFRIVFRATHENEIINGDFSKIEEITIVELLDNYHKEK